MKNDLTGCFAVSLAGHDKCTVYVILSSDEKYVYLADGKCKTIEKPKKKKYKHIQIIKNKDNDLETKINEQTDLSNADLRKSIKSFLSRKKEES